MLYLVTYIHLVRVACIICIHSEFLGERLSEELDYLDANHISSPAQQRSSAHYQSTKPVFKSQVLSMQLCTRFTLGSFCIRSTNFLLNLQDPPPISMKFADNA